jgi:hypothetical protein
MQKFAAVSLTAPHFVQVLAKAWPQFWQNFAWPGFSDWQLSQIVKDFTRSQTSWFYYPNLPLSTNAFSQKSNLLSGILDRVGFNIFHLRP